MNPRPVWLHSVMFPHNKNQQKQKKQEIEKRFGAALLSSQVTMPKGLKLSHAEGTEPSAQDKRPAKKTPETCIRLVQLKLCFRAGEMT